VARALSRSSRGVARAERRGLRRLRTAERETGCGAAGGTRAYAGAASAIGGGVPGAPGAEPGARPRNREPGAVLGEHESQDSGLGVEPTGPFGRGPGDSAPSTLAGLLFLGLIALFLALVALAIKRRPQPRAR
jgi:hypothetical protein